MANKGGVGDTLGDIGSVLGNAFIPQTMDRFRQMDQSGRNQLVQGAEARSLMNGMGATGTPQFNGVRDINDAPGQASLGVKAAATPLIDQGAIMSKLQTAMPDQFNAAALTSMISKAFPAPPEPYTLGENQVRYGTNGQIIGRGPTKPIDTFKPGATRDVRIGSQVVTQEYQPDGSWKQIGSGEAFAPKEPQISEFFDEATGRPYKGVLQPDGLIKRLGGISTPAKTFNNDQNKAAGFANTMAQAEGALNNITVPGADGTAVPYRPNQAVQTASNLPLIGKPISAMSSSEYKQYKQKATDWTLGLLRFESGANVPDSEAEKYWTTYFPQPGDDARVIAGKADSRAQKLKGVIAASGGAYDGLNQAPAKGPAISYKEGATATGPEGAKLVYRGGQWQRM